MMVSPASPTVLTVLYGFYAVFCCLGLLGAAIKQAQASESSLARILAATAFVPAVLVTLGLTPLLSLAHVLDLGRANAAGGVSGARLVAWLGKAIFLAATLALLASAVVQLGADGHLDRGRVDVARLNVK